MATRTVLVDDMDGGDADVTIAFVVNGDSFSLDLSHANAQKFWDAMRPFIAAAEHSKNARETVLLTELAGVEQRAAIRDWARKQGIDIADRGRIPQDIVEEFNRAHKRHQ